MSRIVERALQIAYDEIGVREEGANRGDRVEQYLRAAGLGPGNPWCAAFVYWCIDAAARESDLPNPFLRTGYCPSIENWAEEMGLLAARPEPGDVFLRCSRVNGVYRASHTGFVVKIQGQQYHTIEGNTNMDGGREGIGVFARLRTRGTAYSYVRWSSLVPDQEPRPYTLVLRTKRLFELPIRDGRALAPVRKWGEALGFDVGWDPAAQVALFNGEEVAAPILLIDGVSYAPVRDLALYSALSVTLDERERIVRVGR